MPKLRLGTFSDRELAVLRLVAEGHGNAEIGRLLGRAEDTVRHQLRTAMERTGSRNRAEVVVRAYLMGYVW